MFLAGSLAAGSCDEFSDNDLRIVTDRNHYRHYVEERQKTPSRWPGFLFNEWLPDALHCVSYFKPFNKIDIFYYSIEALKPSPWYGLPIDVLHDPLGIVGELIAQPR